MLLSFLAAAVAVSLEVLIRFPEGHPLYPGANYPWWFIPPYLILSGLLFYAFRNAPSLLAGTAAFGLGTLLVRILASHFILGEHVSGGNAVTAALLGLAVVAKLVIQ